MIESFLKHFKNFESYLSAEMFWIKNTKIFDRERMTLIIDVWNFLRKATKFLGILLSLGSYPLSVFNKRSLSFSSWIERIWKWHFFLTNLVQNMTHWYVLLSNVKQFYTKILSQTLKKSKISKIFHLFPFNNFPLLFMHVKLLVLMFLCWWFAFQIYLHTLCVLLLRLHDCVCLPSSLNGSKRT